MRPNFPQNFQFNPRSLTINFWEFASFSSSVLVLWWNWLLIIFRILAELMFQCDCCTMKLEMSVVHCLLHRAIEDTNLMYVDRTRHSSTCESGLLVLIRPVLCLNLCWSKFLLTVSWISQKSVKNARIMLSWFVLIKKVLFGWCRCLLFSIHETSIHEISSSPSHGKLHKRFATQSYLYVSHRRCLAHQLGKCDLLQNSFVQILGGCVHECREEPFKQSDTDFNSICPRSMWSSKKSLNVVHSIECLHVMKMMESHVCTNRLRIHL